MGLPYRFTDLIRLVFSWKNRDRVMIRSEMRAQRTHASELAKAGVTTVFASDEARPAALEFHGELARRGIRSVITAHGVGVYGPYVRCDHFVFFNRRQREFYEPFAMFGTAEYRSAHPNLKRIRNRPHLEFEPKVIFLQGNWKNAGKEYEYKLEWKGLLKAAEVCREEKLRMVVKVHPNIGVAQLNDLQSIPHVEIVRDLEESESEGSIFVNTLSSSFYDFQTHGPCVFLEDDLLHPQSVFGDEIRTSTVDNLARELRQLSNFKSWQPALLRQCGADQLVTSGKWQRHYGRASKAPRLSDNSGRDSGRDGSPR